MKVMSTLILSIGVVFAANALAADAADNADATPAADTAPAPAKPDKTVWKYSFHDVTPTRPDISKGFCKSHTPDKFITSVDTLANAGMVAKNNIMVKYKSFTNASRYGLYFTEINATLSGIVDGKQWQTDMYIHQQRLEPNGSTFGVWSTPECKGFVTSEVD